MTVTDAALCDRLQRAAFDWLRRSVNPDNGLVSDNSDNGSPASIAVVGFALSAWTIGVKRGWLDRAEALDLTLTTLRFFATATQGTENEVTGHKGFFYHFLDLKAGHRVWNCELSLIDTALLLAGFETASCFFDAPSDAETEIRRLSQHLVNAVDWTWALDGEGTLTQGWHPETGFIRYDWEGYSEALILYAFALGADTHSIPSDSYQAWRRTYQWEQIYGIDLLYAGPLFIHAFSHAWIDFRNINDAFNREAGIGYFENSCRAVAVQREYARRNPRGFKGYSEDCWGLSACDGPTGPMHTVDDIGRTFQNYSARGVPYGPDDGTLVGWGPAAVMPFAPADAMVTLRAMMDRYPAMMRDDCFLGAFNPSVQGDTAAGWVSPRLYGLDQGLLVMMLENHRSGMIWDLLKGSPVLTRGLVRAGFEGGWLHDR